MSDDCANRITIYQGIDFSKTWRWGTEPLIYKSVTAMPSTLPLRLTVTAHGVTDGWQVAMRGLGGFANEPNASDWPPPTGDFHFATVIDANTIEFNNIDAASLGTYTSGGKIAYMTPVSLAGAVVTLKIFNYPPAPGVADDPVLTVDATVDDTAKTIAFEIEENDTALLTKATYSYTVVAVIAGDSHLVEEGIVDSQLPGLTGLPTQ